MKAGDQRLLGNRHVVELAASFDRLRSVDVEHGGPARIAHEQRRMIVTSDCISRRPEPDAMMNDVSPGVWPTVAKAVMPGATSLSHSYFVTLLDTTPMTRRAFLK